MIDILVRSTQKVAFPYAFQIIAVCFSFQSYHDDYSMWFDVVKEKSNEEDDEAGDVVRPFCDYPPRTLWSRPRLGMINDTQRNTTIAQALHKLSSNLDSDGTCLCVSDFSLLPLVLAQCNTSNNKILALENNKLAQRGLVNLIKHNNLQGSIDVELRDDKTNLVAKLQQSSVNRISLLVGEPFFTSSILPWHDLYFWYVRSELQNMLSPNVKIMPRKATLWIAGVEFEDLWKIRSPVGTVEGFDISIMDNMIDKALQVKEYHEPEPHALWEYGNQLVTAPTAVMTFNLEETVPERNIEVAGAVKFDSNTASTHCHGIAMWMEYELVEDLYLSTGLRRNTKKDSVSATPEWSRHYKQGVFLLKQPHCVDHSKRESISYKLAFHPETGEVSCVYDVVSTVESR